MVGQRDQIKIAHEPGILAGMLPLQYDSGWHGLTVPRINTHTLARRGEELLQHLAHLGVSLPSGNRIQLAIRTLDQLNSDRIVPNANDPLGLEATTSALRTLWEAFFIVNAALERPGARKAFPSSLLRCLLKGAAVARGESNSLARDRQCEMFVAAMLATGGADVVSSEPDLRFLYHSEYVGVAVKRMQSMDPDELVKDMRKGAKQIAHQGLRGFLAINIDGYLDSLPLEGLAVAVGEQFNESVSEAHRAFMRLTDRPSVIGVFLFGTRAAWVFDDEKPTIRWTNPMQWVCFSELEPKERFRDFFVVHFAPRLEAGLARVGALLS